ncbi:AEC family transporter [Labilibacter sediminis]|nr:AEC family transporter [Labilibacter sediminis]
MFGTLFINVFTVFLMMIPGYLIIKKKVIEASALKDFSQVIIKILYPCLIFSSITKNFTIASVINSWQLPVSVLLIFVIGYFIGLAYNGFFSGKDIQHRKSVLYQFTINNFSFLPLAIIAKLYNDQYVAALILSTLGAEVVVWTVGMSILNSEKKGFKKSNLKHLLSPPLVSIYFSLIVLLFFHFINVPLQSMVEKHIFLSYTQKTIYQLGQATIPLSMIMVGGRMGKIQINDLKIADIWIVTLFRLIIIPFIAVLALKALFPNHPFVNVMLIVAVMPNSIASLVVGELYNADQKIMSGTVLVTHIISLFTIPLWLMFLLK